MSLSQGNFSEDDNKVHDYSGLIPPASRLTTKNINFITNINSSVKYIKTKKPIHSQANSGITAVDSQTYGAFKE